MDEDKDYIELVEQARLGNRESLDTLAELVRGRLCAYVYRIVLQEQLANDIVQESMLEMFKVLDKLERADRFWPWLRGIAFNKIHEHHREEKNRRTVITSQPGNPSHPAPEDKAGLAKMVAEELTQAVINTMGELKPQYRKVLTMRCYEGMEYSLARGYFFAGPKGHYKSNFHVKASGEGSCCPLWLSLGKSRPRIKRRRRAYP